MANDGTVKIGVDVDEKEFKSGLSKLGDTAKGAMNGLGEETERVSDGLKSAGENALSFGDILKANILSDLVIKGISKIANGLKSIASSSIGVGMDFDSSMSQVATTMGKTVDEIQDLRDAALEAGSTTAFSAPEVADALNYLALAGYDAATAADTLPAVLNLAAAGSMDLAYASDLATDAMSALGIEAGNEKLTKFGDQMAVTASKANTSVSQLGEAILQVGATAKMLSGGTTELNAALGILADNGTKGAEGGTRLRNIILSLTAPTDTAAEQLKKLKVSAFDASGNMRPLEDTLHDLYLATVGYSDEKRTDVINKIFNKTDIGDVNYLLGVSRDRWYELQTAIDNSSGAMQNMADTQLDNLEGDITKFKSALEGAQIALSDKLTPSLRDFVQFGTEAVGKLPEVIKNLDFDSIFSSLKDTLSNIDLDSLLKTIGDLISGLLSFAQAIAPVVSAVAQLAAQLFEFFEKMNPQVKLFLVGFLGAIVAVGKLRSAISSVGGAVSGVGKIASAFSTGAGDQFYNTFLKWSVIILAVVAAVTALIAAINVLVGKGDEMKSTFNSMSGATNNMGGGAARPRAKAAASPARMAAAPASEESPGDGEEGTSLTASAFSRASAVRALASAIPNAENRVAVATAAMAPVAGYSAPPPVYYNMGGGDYRPTAQPQAPQVINIRFTGDLAELGRILKPVIDAENRRMGPGV